ncbi:unnamed protein product [Owenia fusiformis]|uniref:Uncharacterized protein n=1 Tax=Owenia fusiformis TaxID=6347 RepID=A0A8J1T587_OWEFU|nr:unnamed protein product [Owenia fusiformis]
MNEIDSLLSGYTVHFRQEMTSMGWWNKITYGWLVVLAGFFSHLFTYGISWSVGVFFVVYLDAFQESKGMTAWTGSLNTACMYGIGPVASILTNKFGYRVTMMTGGVLSAVGLATSALSTNIYHLYVTFGIVTGCGFGICYIPTIAVLAVYFSKNLTLAFGLSSAGVGIGTFVYPPLITSLISLYGWRGCMLILSAITLNLCVCGAIMKPNPIQTSSLTEVDERCPMDDIETSAPQNNVFDIKVLTNLNFLFMCLSSFLYCFGHSIVYVHFGEYAITRGIKENQATFLFSVIGISNLIGKLIYGSISTVKHPCANIILMFAISLTSSGLLTMTIPFQTGYPLLVIFSVVFGVCSAAFGVLPSGIVHQFLGTKNLATGYGILCIFCAMGTLPGAPIAGEMFDSVKRYAESFYLGGVAIGLSGVIMIIPYLRTRTSGHLQNNINVTAADDFTKQSLLDIATDH